MIKCRSTRIGELGSTLSIHPLKLLFSPDLYSPQTIQNLANLLLAPVSSYQSVLTLLALPQYPSLFFLQPLSTRRSLAHGLISSVLKNETIIETPEDVDGVLELCQVLIREQPEESTQQYSKDGRRSGSHGQESEELAEEQGWVARMVHLFRSDSLDVQFEVSSFSGQTVLTSLRGKSFSYYKELANISKLVANECVIHSHPLSRLVSSWPEGTKNPKLWYVNLLSSLGFFAAK